MNAPTAKEEKATEARTGRRVLRTVLVVIAFVVSAQTVMFEIVPVLRSESSAHWVAYLALGVLFLGVFAFVPLLNKYGNWTAWFSIVVFNCVAVFIALFAYSDPEVGRIGLLWISPVVYGACAYFFEWNVQRRTG